jgi:hypothetical protein
MRRKHFLITEAQYDYLRTLAEATGESEGHFVRQAIELHAKHFDPSSIPNLIYEKLPTLLPNESEYKGSQERDEPAGAGPGGQPHRPVLPDR